MICDWWISIRFVCFYVSRFVACGRNYDWRQRKTQLWRRPLNLRVRMFVKSAVKLVAKLQLKLPLKKAHNYLYSVSVMYVYTKYISFSIGYFRVSRASVSKRGFAQPSWYGNGCHSHANKSYFDKKGCPDSTWPHLESEGFCNSEVAYSSNKRECPRMTANSCIFYSATD